MCISGCVLGIRHGAVMDWTPQAVAEPMGSRDWGHEG